MANDGKLADFHILQPKNWWVNQFLAPGLMTFMTFMTFMSFMTTDKFTIDNYKLYIIKIYD